MRQLDAERNVLRQRGEQFAQRQGPFARHLALAEAELAEQRRVRLTRLEHAIGDLRIWKIFCVERLHVGRAAARAREMQRIDADHGVALCFGDELHGLLQGCERTDHGEFQRAGESELPREIASLHEIVALS